MSSLEEATVIALQEDHEELSEVYAIVTEDDQKNEDPESLEKELYRPFSCPACNKGFTRKGDMLRHHRKHTGEKPFQCTNCGDEFTRKDDMIRHYKTHEGIKPHKCPVCQKSFCRKADMVKHLLVHAGIKACGCPTCGCPFSHGGGGHSAAGVKHFSSFSGRSSGGALKHGCPECAESFKRKMDLNAHIKSEHPDFLKVDTHRGPKHIIHLKKDDSVMEDTELEENEDVIASASLLNECESQKNNQTIEDDNPNMSNNVFQNIRTRRGPKKTTKSPTKAKKDNKRKVPEKYTSSQKQFGCPICPQHFGRKADMIRHLRIHSGVKPFNCSFCNKTFSRKEDCLRHTKTHSSSSKFTCKFCDTGFAKRTEYAMHILEHIDK